MTLRELLDRWADKVILNYEQEVKRWHDEVLFFAYAGDES